MTPSRQYGPLDDVPEVYGDSAFIGLDMRNDPASLRDGLVARSENMRFEADGAIVRLGLSRKIPAGLTVGPVYCSGVYRPRGSGDRIALVCSNCLRLFNPADQSIATYYYPSPEVVTDTDTVDVVQAGVGSGTLVEFYILRGESKSVLKFDGAAMSVDTDFEQGNAVLFYQNRMAVITDAFTVAVSDFLDFSSWSTLNQFQILSGGDDYLVGIVAWQRDYVIIAARKRVFVAFFDPETATGGYDGSIKAASSFLRELTRQAGPVGRHAIAEAAGLIWFISDSGIYAFQPQLDQELSVLGEPISAGIQPIMDRLSSDYAARACIAHLGHRVYFAMPISDEPIKITAISEDVQARQPTSTTYDGVGACYFTDLIPGETYYWTPGANETQIESGLSILNEAGIFQPTFSTAVVFGAAGLTYTGQLVQLVGLTLPFDLPANLSFGAIVTVTTASAHSIAPGDIVQITGASSTLLNGIFTVNSVPSISSFTISTDTEGDAVIGTRARVQRLATRNNRIAVWNLKLKDWESVDTLPQGLYADRMFRSDYGNRQRLWLVDRDAGPVLYEEGDVDESSDIEGALALEFDLPAELSEANYGATAIQGLLLSRAWSTGTVSRRIASGEARLTLAADDAAFLTLLTRMPGRHLRSVLRSVTADPDTDDMSQRLPAGWQAVESQIQLEAQGGRPSVRAWGITAFKN